ncbi:MTH1187 family thiamine-binding protein [Paenibacillus albiflavus]|uniref:MTH1187 family thiamine-binding protein n=1 Tax=Paenibacillus albiflavus TaxID=2545760 RepID=A0A4R4E284_9BACL|nr:MTH1187 family thiamine-binding protein [Paenibacillus albiflavus]TCZ72863.1 MTH1187 family thiamine-binding protein [Paenibacillus albiflavus]
MAIAEVTIIPLGTGSTSVSQYVAEIEKVLAKQEGVTHELTPMSTLIEGPLDRLFEVIQVLHEVPFANGAGRVSTSIKIDDRRDKPSSMAQKLKSVADKM